MLKGKRKIQRDSRPGIMELPARPRGEFLSSARQGEFLSSASAEFLSSDRGRHQQSFPEF